MNDKIRQISGGELKVMRRLNAFEFGVELWVMREGLNENNWDYRNLEQLYKTFVGQPILTAYVGSRVGDGHNMTEKTDAKTGERYYSFTGTTAERIVGTLSDDISDFEIVVRDGKKWLKAKGKLFAFYARELVELIVEQGCMEVSAETLINEESKEGTAEVFTDWTGLGVTVLGKGVSPAIPGATIATLAAMQEELKIVKLRAASLVGQKPQENNCKKGMRRLSMFNTKQLAELGARFTGWTVMAACEDEGVIHVALRNDNWDFARYTMNSADETFAPERVEKVAVCADFGSGLFVDVNAMMESNCAALAAANNALETARNELGTANNTITAMQTAENARRIAAAKESAQNTMEAFNAAHEFKLNATALDAVNRDIESGVYTNCVNKDGAWVGEEAVANAVFALCAKEETESNRRSNSKAFVWDKLGGKRTANSGEAGGISELLSRKGVRK